MPYSTLYFDILFMLSPLLFYTKKYKYTIIVILFVSIL